MSYSFGDLFRSTALRLAVIFVLAVMPLTSQDKNASTAKTAVPGIFRAGAKPFSLPSPVGDLVEVGPDYRVLLEVLAPTGNRLVAAFVPADDLALLRSGKSKPMPVYALFEVPRSAEFLDASGEDFKSVVSAIGEKFGAGLDDAMKGQEEDLNRRLKALNPANGEVTLDKPIELGRFFSKPDASGFGIIMPISANGTTVKMATGIVAVRVRSRVMFGYLYCQYKDEDTVKWLRKTSEDWADAILKANQG